MESEDADLARVWRDDRWLMSNDLNDNTVLDYFALSDWYDNTCLTSMLKMQTQASGGDMQRAQQTLKNMPGVDYQLSHSQVQP
ncbi:hypothetical protein T484DRAFT_2957240 [Baffinella frigidus]|nr:hypothetical protein T484DRAFT_2957240 [Cryptophyta sp. CCMP2293]